MKGAEAAIGAARGVTEGARAYIFAGGFGSGKTEIAVNFSLRLTEEAAGSAPARRGEERRPAVYLLDLDTVNPYFRSRRLSRYLAEAGVEVISTAPGKEWGDVPALSAKIAGVLRRGEEPIVADVAGDKVGATVLGSLAPWLREAGYRLYLVANPFRPFTRTAAEVAAMAEVVAGTARLDLTGLVANPHLREATQPEDIQAGLAVVKEAAAELAVPVSFLAVQREWAEAARQWADGIPLLPLRLFFRRPWE
ncbi:MAG: hypothetical protein QJR13_08890 [Bacillota bacterium]|nr:hypothetical protein [Bacillota bacterium]